MPHGFEFGGKIAMMDSKYAESFDAVCIGAGIIGLTTAYELALAGLRTAVVERGSVGREASWAGAGIISPADWASARTPYDRLRAFSFARYPQVSAEIDARTGVDIGFRRTGAFDRQTKIHWPDFCQVRNPWLLRGMAAACDNLGVRIIENFPVAELGNVGDQRLQVASNDGRTLAARNVVVAAGPWSAELVSLCGRQLPIVPVRGQVVALQTDSPAVKEIVLDGKRYLVPRDDGLVLVGSTEEYVGFEKVTTDLAILELREFASEIHPTLRTATVVKAWAGLRPGCALGTPIIERVPGYNGLWVAAGHFREGIQLAPGTARLLADWILGVPSFATPLDFCLEADRSAYERPFES